MSTKRPASPVAACADESTSSARPLAPFDRLPDELIQMIANKVYADAENIWSRGRIDLHALAGCNRRLYELTVDRRWKASRL